VECEEGNKVDLKKASCNFFSKQNNYYSNDGYYEARPPFRLHENSLINNRDAAETAIEIIAAIGAGFIVAECDKKLTMTLKKMGIDSFILGESIDYICSETLPIYIKSDWLQQYISVNTERYFQKESTEDCKFFLERKKNISTEKIML
jgi:hypothetical protein